MQALELLRLPKWHIPALIIEEIKPVPLAVSELYFSEVRHLSLEKSITDISNFGNLLPKFPNFCEILHFCVHLSRLLCWVMLAVARDIHVSTR